MAGIWCWGMMMSDGIEPKPCKCGDEIKVYFDHVDAVGPAIGGGYYLSHPLWKIYPDTWGCDVLPPQEYFDTRAEAIASWNTRA